MEEFDIKWMTNWKRIRSLFISVENENITVHGMGFDYHVKTADPSLAKLAADYIAQQLAGKSIGMTESVLREMME